MTQEDLDKNKFASQRVITVADELIKKLEINDRTIAERRISMSASASSSKEFVSILDQILGEVRSPRSDDMGAHLTNISSIISSVMKQLEDSIRSSNDDIIRLEATQDGMRRALLAVRESGVMQEKELEKIEVLSHSENPEARRKVGEHPETFSTKRNAATLKKSRESSNT